MNYVEQYTTLSCVINKIGGDLISMHYGKGFILEIFLQKHKSNQVSKYIVFRCFDGYDVGIPSESGLMDVEFGHMI